MKILVTGGAGFIGSHTTVELLAAGHDVVVVDDLSNGHATAVARAGELGGRPASLHVGDIRDRSFLDGVFAEHSIDAVIHFAAKKAVEESMERPELYYDVNVGGTATLCAAMRAAGVRRCVFSS